MTCSDDNKTAFGKTWGLYGNYMKWGAYNAGICNFLTTTFYNNLRAATAFAETKPGSS